MNQRIKITSLIEEQDVSWKVKMQKFILLSSGMILNYIFHCFLSFLKRLLSISIQIIFCKISYVFQVKSSKFQYPCFAKNTAAKDHLDLKL